MKLIHHGPQDYQSLLMHREAVRMVLADASLIEKALATLARWDAISDPRSKPLRDLWVQILSSRNWSLALEETELGNQLRQASPMSTLLPISVRLAVIAEVTALKEAASEQQAVETALARARLMKIHVISDLHLEFAPFVPDPVAVEAADVIVLAGDISTGAKGIPWARKTFAGKPIIYVAGNHEFYKHHWTRLIPELRDLAAIHGIHFLENDSVTIDGVRFLGCTLWTDFLLFGEDKKPEAMSDSLKFMNDFSEIRADSTQRVGKTRSTLSTDDTIRRHQESLAWLKSELACGDPDTTVVITHHYPSRRSTGQKWTNDLVSAIFGSNLPTEVLLGAKLWIHGHTHESCNYRIGDSKRSVRVVCNPRGYPLGWHQSEFENASFQPGLVIDFENTERNLP